ncbi:MAG: hypothetical protein JWR88_1023, partial [Pseudonocardia sp.]|nr:hypothetical protein [Pseudonocardia sp.]
MASAAPQGAVAPHTGELPAGCLDDLGGRPFGVYVHVP